MEKFDENFFIIDEIEYCNEEQCLARLLKDEVLFCNQREYLDIDFITDEKGVVKGSKPSMEIAGRTTILFVNCNDLFAWGCADSEDLLNEEIGPLYKMHMSDPEYGASKWCCIKRNMKPQKPIVDRWKKAGRWDDQMEALQDNPN